MLFIYPTPQYPRRPLEYVFKFLYLVSNVIHTSSIVILIADFYTRLQDSMPEYYTNNDFVMAPGIEMVMKNCTYAGEIRLGNARGVSEVTLGSMPMALMSMAQYVSGLFALEFLLVANNVLCSLNYSTGNRHLRICGVHVPYYHIGVSFTFFYSFAIIALTWAFDADRRFYDAALTYCAQELGTNNPTALLEAEYDNYSIFTTAVYWPFAATCFGLLIYFSAAVVLCWFSEDQATVLLSEADAPWESRGPLCCTSKPLLRLHTAQRNAIIDDARKAISEGQTVRIVRSYQLMTEDDFNTLVQAMRDQVNQAVKEKQFEMLNQHFGDRVSQIDNDSFAWRQNYGGGGGADGLAAGAAIPADADQFYDVHFGEYFTDNELNPSEYPVEDRPLGAGEGNRGAAAANNNNNVVYNTDPAYEDVDDVGRLYGPSPYDDEYYNGEDGAAGDGGEWGPRNGRDAGGGGGYGPRRRRGGGARRAGEDWSPYEGTGDDGYYYDDEYDDEDENYDVGGRYGEDDYAEGGAGYTPQGEDEEEEEGVDDAGRVVRHHRKHRRRHHRRRADQPSVGGAPGTSARAAEGGFDDEPEPRTPMGRESRSQRAGGGVPTTRGPVGGGGGGGSRRQAEVDEVAEYMDEFADDGPGFDQPNRYY